MVRFKNIVMCAIGLVLTGGLVTSLAMFIYGAEYRALHQWVRAVGDQLEMSRAAPPSGISPAEWDNTIDYAKIAFGNCFIDPQSITNRERFDSFSESLRKVNPSDIDLNTINWIWDEIALISRNGPSYSEKFRPIALPTKTGSEQTKSSER
jgi:hypothetical protein